jgi:hypothetical protein
LIVNLKAGARAFYFLLCWCITLLITSCNDKAPTQAVSQNPQIVLIQAPPSAYQFPAAPIGIHVRADDPQGVNTLTGVDLTVRKINSTTPLTTVAMYDNGQNGDILPKDGQYFWPIDTALVHSQTGDFILEAVAKDQSSLTSETARDTLKILAGRENLAPKLLSFSIPTTISGDSIYAPVFRATASDADGLASLRFVRVEFFPPAFSKPTLIDSLFDDGKNNDGAANDGVFARAISTSKLCGEGAFSVLLRAIDAANGESPALIGSTNVKRSGINLSPAVSNLNAPATISRNRVPNAYVLSIQASDPNCITDLKRVFFNTFLPNGNASSGNPFAMRDDGKEGDAVASDGRYSLTIQITPQNATGNYRFEFQAEDKRGALSNKIIQTITVTD